MDAGRGKVVVDRRRGRGGLAAAVCFLLLVVGTTSAVAENANPPAGSVPSSQETVDAIEAENVRSFGSELTDPTAAEGMPGQDLSRSEALELMRGVFEPLLQSPAGAFDELHVEKFLADNVAVISAGEQPEAVGIAIGDESSDQHEGATLMNSTLPLRTEGDSGHEEVVDLGLQHSEGELQSVNPLVEVGIPTELGEGIDLPEIGVGIELVGAPEERSPSTVDGSVAFYPNVAEDTDFAIAPTPTGIETLTHLQSADSPRSQAFKLTLPEGASLQASKDSGAEVTSGDEILLGVSPPTALDATGADVPVSLEVAGDSLILTASPEESAVYPILVDPLFQSYNWTSEKWAQVGVTGNFNLEQWNPELVRKTAFSYNIGNEYGLNAYGSGKATAGDHSSYVYAVPRYYTDQTFIGGLVISGTAPTSFISHMTLSNLVWTAKSANKQPYLVAGLWDTNNGWASLLTHEGLTGHGLNDTNFLYQFNNANANTNVKLASVGTWAQETVSSSGPNNIRVGSATVELAEPATANSPGFGSVSGPSQWVNQTAAPINFTVSDTGLGVYAMTVADVQATPHSWKTTYNCTGVGGKPCPRTWSSVGYQPVPKYEPSVLPQGTNTLKLTAEDPLGHVSSIANVQVKVDHTAPSLSLSGPLTEQGTLGTGLSHYTLKLNASDGTEVSAQSGAASTEIKVDGKKVDYFAPGCSTKNCALEHEWIYNAYGYSVGKHTIEAIATDAVGLTTTKTVAIESQGPFDTTSPSVAFSGSMTEQATLGTDLLHYTLKLNATDGTEGSPQAGVASTQIKVDGSQVDSASPGCSTQNCAITREWTLNSQSYSAGKHTVEAIATDAVGLTTIKTLVIESHPDATAPLIALSGTMTKQDTLGTSLRHYGLKLSATDGTEALPQTGVASTQIKVDGSQVDSASPGCSTQNCAITREWTLDSTSYSKGTHAVEVMATDAAGHQGTKSLTIELAPDVTAPAVSLSGTMTEQAALGLARPGYNLKIDASDPSAPEGPPAEQSSFGSYGSGDGELSYPKGIATDSEGNIWVADTSNSRIQKFNAEGEYLSQFGSEGSGDGQFYYPSGIAVDPEGNIWVADLYNNRIQKFNSEGEYLTQFGSYGSGDGQFYSPAGIAADSEGNVWVVDMYGSRIQKFDAEGAYLDQFGSEGSGNGQLLYPEGGIATDAEGNIWVADTYNNRIQKFNSEGEYLDQFGSEGSDDGQFYYPAGLTTDAEGSIWVADTSGSRIQKFNAEGEYQAQFGSEGEGAGQFYTPAAIAIDPDGHAWVADTGNSRVQEWGPAGSQPSGVVATTIKVDGKAVDTSSPGCSEGGCSISRQWTLGSLSYSAGEHEVEAIATDAFGNATTKTLEIEVQRDNTSPGLDVSGSLVETPEGWVEQDGYSITGSAQDADFGVAQLKLTIDGEQVDSATQSCNDGACDLSHTFAVDAASYSGGAHPAELVATDGAGNMAKHKWTMNVNPDGNVTPEEVTDTLEAVDSTSDSTVVAPTEQVLEPEQIEGGNNPGLKLSGTEIESTGTPDKTTMTTDPEDGFTIESPEGATTITPIVNENSSSVSIAEGVAGVAANVSHDADSVIRPEYNGAQTFQAIRSESSPEAYSWQVQLAEGQMLRLANPTQAEVVYEDGTIAFLITAETAHDATGATVPTSLEVSGNVLTLNVDIHFHTFVYPIIAGAGWETSYTVPVIVEKPEDEAEVKQREQEEKELKEQEELEAQGGEGESEPGPPVLAQNKAQAEKMLRNRVQNYNVAAPPYPPAGGATASKIRTFTVEERYSCSISNCHKYRVYIKNPSFRRGPNWAEWEPGTQVHCGWSQSWYYAPLYIVTEHGCGFTELGKVYKCNSCQTKHLTIWSRFLVGIPYPGGIAHNYIALQVWVWPNGFQQEYVGDWE